VLGLLISACLCNSSASAAGCNLARFDQTPPPAITRPVDNQFANFVWASDVDRIDGRLWVWHYIENTHPTLGLGARWEKAGIYVPLTDPIVPGEAACNQFLADSVRNNPDTDAPIVYGTNEQRQVAAVYVADQPQRLSSSSTITTSYVDQQGKRANLSVILASGLTDKGMYLQLEHPPDVIVGISGFPQSLSDSQFAAVARTARAEISPFSTFVKGNGKQVLGELYSSKQAEERLGEKFLFFTGAPGSRKTLVEIPARSTKKITADLIVLDSELRPLIASDVMVLVPDNQ
jgi:hypothetical protein